MTPQDRRHSHLVFANTVLLFAVVVLTGALFWQDEPIAERMDSTGRPAQLPAQEKPARSREDSPSDARGPSIGSLDAAPSVLDESPVREIAEEEAATIALFKAASPSVVHITTHRVQRDYFSLNLLEIPRGSGTGFVWDDQGHIVTNYHVIKDADIAYVSFEDQSTQPARLVGAAPEKDLAVLKVESTDGPLRPLPTGTSADLEVGLKAFAIGNPFGLDHTLTTGVVSALGREIESTTGLPIKDVIQTDAAINPGNSGGPLLDSNGKLIGVNTAIFSPSGTYAGIGFAIPVDVVKWVVPELIEHGRIIRSGLSATFAPDRLMKQLGTVGVLILGIEPGSNAEQSGLRPTQRTRSGRIRLGDIIVGINDLPVRNNKDLILALENFEVGEEVTVRVMRDGEETELQTVLQVAD